MKKHLFNPNLCLFFNLIFFFTKFSLRIFFSTFLFVCSTVLEIESKFCLSKICLIRLIKFPVYVVNYSRSKVTKMCYAIISLSIARIRSTSITTILDRTICEKNLCEKFFVSSPVFEIEISQKRLRAQKIFYTKLFRKLYDLQFFIIEVDLIRAIEAELKANKCFVTFDLE